MAKALDLTGQKFGKLTAVKRAGKNKFKQTLWECRCDCGKITYVPCANLRSGNTKSCGCLNHEGVKNPRSKDRLYHVWLGMKERCSPTAETNSKCYSDKGISVCEEWKDNFPVFKEWMLENGYDYSKSRKEQSIDRKDNSKGYSPDNCRIVTHSVNCRNKDNNRLLTYNGETLTATEWAERLGIPQKRILSRMDRMDDAEKILFGELNSDKSNTGIKGISYQKSNNRFILHINHKYLGCFKTLEEAVKRKEEYIKSNGA